MSELICEKNISIPNQLANWLAITSSEPSLTSQITYHLGGRVCLLGASSLCAAEALGRAVVGSFESFAYLMTLGQWQQAKKLGLEQMQETFQAGSKAFSCFISIISPKELVHRLVSGTVSYLVEAEGLSTSEKRTWCIRQGAELIENKLQRQLQRAQNQMAREPDKAFQYLSAPSRFQVEHGEGASDPKVGVCHFIGRRETMEDEHLETSFNLYVGSREYPVQLFGIFDGHGGDEASRYVRKNFEHELHRTLNKFCSEGLTDVAIWNALKITFARLNAEFNGSDSAGTTATVVMILDGNLWTASAGDSRAILDNGVQLSEDAKPIDPYYKQGIENRGGNVSRERVNGILAVARAIGDHDLKGVNARPKISVYPIASLPQKSHLIIACDGIYDVASTRQVAAAVRAHREESTATLAANIVYSAYEAGSTDNLSTLVIRLN